METPRPIAVLTGDVPPGMDPQAIALQLLRGDVAVVVWIGVEAPGAAIVHCHGRGPGDDVLDDAACATWALKAIGGWDESMPMTFHVTQTGESGRSAWVTVRATWSGELWRVDCQRLRPGAWNAVRDAITGGAGSTIVLVDVDCMKAYNEAHGLAEGDLMLARVQACVERAADRAAATMIRVGGDRFVLVGGATSSELAEAARRDVEAMGRVTISAGWGTHVAGMELRDVLEAAVGRAKAAGRNRVEPA